MLYEGDFFRSLFAELGDTTSAYLKGRRIRGKNRNGSSELTAVITQQGGKRSDGELTPFQFHQQILTEAQDLSRWIDIPTVFTSEKSPYQFILTVAGSRHTCDEMTALDGTILPAQIIIWVFDRTNPAHPVRMYEVAEMPEQEQQEFTLLSEQAYTTAVLGLKKASKLSDQEFFDNVYTYLVHGNQSDAERLELGGGRGAGSNTMMHSMVTVFTEEAQRKENRIFRPDEVLKFSSPLDSVFMRHTAQSLAQMLRAELPLEQYPYVRIHPSLRFGEKAMVIEFDPLQDKQTADAIAMRATRSIHKLQQASVAFFEKMNQEQATRATTKTAFIQDLMQNFHFEESQARWLAEYVSCLQPDIIQLENWLASADLTPEDRKGLSLRLKRNYAKAARYAEGNPQSYQNRRALSRKIRHIIGGGHLSDITPLTYLMTDRLIPGDVTHPHDRLKLLKNARAVYLPKEASFVVSQKPHLDPDTGEIKVCCVCFTNRHATHKGGAESIQNAPIERAQKL